jgi:hypothetical protein
MSDNQSVETPAPAQLTDHDLDEVAGGLLPAVAPAPVAVSSQPVLPAVQRNLIGLL